MTTPSSAEARKPFLLTVIKCLSSIAQNVDNCEAFALYRFETADYFLMICTGIVSGSVSRICFGIEYLG